MLKYVTPKNKIDEIMGDITSYLNPELLKNEYKDLLDFSKINKDNLQKYIELLSSINYAWQKIMKYELYFKEFYSTSGDIEKFEQLNHHIHAYLQDVDTLKNKIENFFGALKNDLKKVAENKKEIIEFLEAGIEKNNQTFKGILKYRIQHVHKVMRFIDGDLIKAENAQKTIEAFSNPVFEKFIDKEKIPKAIVKLEKNKEESFELAKNRWLKNAERNRIQTTGYLNSILNVISPTLYQFLEIKSMKEIMQENESNT